MTVLQVARRAASVQREETNHRFELVTTVERFRELEQTWEELWGEFGTRAFQSYPWVAAWARDMGSSYQLRIGVMWRQDGKLAAVLPMAIRTFFGLRILEWAGQAVCDYCDGLGPLADLQTAWTALRQTGGIDIIRLKNIETGSNVTRLFTQAGLFPDEVCLKVVSTWTSGDTWFRTLNKKKRNNFSRGQRILEASGPTSIICHESVPDEALLRHLFDLKKAWLKVTRQSSYLIDDKHPDRLLNLTSALAKVGRLRLFLIRCGDDIVSASVNIADGDSVGAFFAVYNPAFDRASPGVMLMTAYTRWAFNSGFAEIDYLRGDEGYKLEFANAQTPLLSFVATATLRGYAALMIQRQLSRIAKFGESTRNLSRTGGAYTTRAGNARAITIAK